MKQGPVNTIAASTMVNIVVHAEDGGNLPTFDGAVGLSIFSNGTFA